MSNFLDILRHEFEAGEHSFLLKMRCDLTWDPEAFARLTAAMEAGCQQTTTDVRLDRWLATGFWYVSSVVPDWTRHAEFRRRNPDIAYEAAYERLWELAYWFFMGQAPVKRQLEYSPNDN